jgi:hypothetical protein
MNSALPPHFAIAGAIALASLAATCQAADIYRWTDAQGKVHLSDKPPPGNPDAATRTETKQFEPSAAERKAALERAARDKARLAEMEKQRGQAAMVPASAGRGRHRMRAQAARVPEKPGVLRAVSHGDRRGAAGGPGEMRGGAAGSGAVQVVVPSSHLLARVFRTRKTQKESRRRRRIPGGSSASSVSLLRLLRSNSMWNREDPEGHHLHHNANPT